MNYPLQSEIINNAYRFDALWIEMSQLKVVGNVSIENGKISAAIDQKTH